MTLQNKDILTFVISRKVIEGRFDVNYYKPEYRQIVENLKRSPFELRNLDKIISFSNERWKKPKTGNFRYIEISDIDTSSAEIIQAKELDVEKAPSRAQMVVRKNDIIISMTRPYRGAIALVNREFDNCICSTGFSVLRQSKININRKYLLRFLHSDFALKQMEQRMTGGNYPAIVPAELENILVSLPPKEVQEKITNIFDKALSEKKENERKARSLLGSIDDFILTELGIGLQTFNEVGSSDYSIGSNYLSKNRWDVRFWKTDYRRWEKAIKNSRFKTLKFSEFIKEIVNGIDYRIFCSEGKGTRYLRVSNIKPFEIDETDIKHIQLLSKDVSKNILLKNNDILLTRKGTFGVAVLINNRNKDYLISSEIFKLALKRNIKINYFYIVSILNCLIGKYQFSRKSVGAIMGSLSQESVKSILIPFPPKFIQDKIATEVMSRLEDAKKFKTNARNVVEDARIKTQRIILGEVKI